jgi:dephospho-CoA kinase
VHLFGLTGGIASGKSAVAARLSARHLPVLDADALAREVVQPGTPGLEEIVHAFGRGVLLPDGSLDRKAMAGIVFADDTKRKALNAIVHPRITALSAERAGELAARGEPLGCYEAALIVENGLAPALRPLVVVASPEDLQIARTVTRDGVARDEARARIRAQMPLAEKIKVADYVIENTGTLEELARRSDAVLESVCKQLGVDVSRYVERAEPNR